MPFLGTEQQLTPTDCVVQWNKILFYVVWKAKPSVMNFLNFAFFTIFLTLIRRSQSWDMTQVTFDAFNFPTLLWSAIVDRFLILDDDCWLSSEAKLYLKWNLIYGNWIISHFNLVKFWLFTVRRTYTILCLRTLLAVDSVQRFQFPVDSVLHDGVDTGFVVRVECFDQHGNVGWLRGKIDIVDDGILCLFRMSLLRWKTMIFLWRRNTTTNCEDFIRKISSISFGNFAFAFCFTFFRLFSAIVVVYEKRPSRQESQKRNEKSHDGEKHECHRVSDTTKIRP